MVMPPIGFLLDDLLDDVRDDWLADWLADWLDGWAEPFQCDAGSVASVARAVPGRGD
jgi:hypothetical protein